MRIKYNSFVVRSLHSFNENDLNTYETNRIICNVIILLNLAENTPVYSDHFSFCFIKIYSVIVYLIDANWEIVEDSKNKTYNS